jgi:hypothetical protein
MIPRYSSTPLHLTKSDDEPSGFRLKNIDSRNAKILDIEEIPAQNLFNSNFPGALIDRWLMAFGGINVTA